MIYLLKSLIAGIYLVIKMEKSRALVCLLFGLCVAAEIGYAEQSTYCYKKKTEDDFQVGWICDESNKCLKSFTTQVNSKECLYSLNVCKLLCDNQGSLWPRPSKAVNITKKLINIATDKISFKFDRSGLSVEVWNMFENLQEYFISIVSPLLKNKNSKSGGSQLTISVNLTNEKLSTFTYNTSEGYYLTIKTINNGANILVNIIADNYFGIRHGVETLLQLIVFDDFSKSLLIPENAEIIDAPAYKHRGILLDTSRSFISIKSIKRMLDAMAQNKLNTFHWHITDSHSFPLQSKNYPQMSAYGAYSPSQVYTWSDIKEIVQYARFRGIRVIPELDAPSHVGEGWQYFNEGKSENDSLVLCFKAEPWRNYCVEPPCGIFNPVNEKVYEVLNKLYAEFNTLFDSDVFHMGGDEVSYKCWQGTSTVLNWMVERNMTINDAGFLELWSYFQNKALQQFDNSAKNKNSKIILWTSSLTETDNITKFLDIKRYIIQIWTTIADKQIAHLLKNGYDVIFSNYDALYFDCGFGAWIGEGNNWCSPYIGWQKVYMNDPLKAVQQDEELIQYSNVNVTKQILGSEATLWSEQSDDSTLDTRLWPRACALAERLWTNPTTDWRSAESRILTQRERMLSRGIHPDLLEPPWCHQNEGLCY